MATYYRICTYDERDNNWITLRDNLDGGPLIYLAYLDCLCSKCHSLDRDAVFARKNGLEAGPKIRVKTGRELAHSSDGFLCIKTRVLNLLKKHHVSGFETRPIPYTDWHALRVTTKVAYTGFVPHREKPPCKTCGRGAYYGIANSLSQIALPSHENSFFTPKLERGQAQDIYITEKVGKMLKANRVKAAELHRLLTDEETRLLSEATPAARRKVKERFIVL